MLAESSTNDWSVLASPALIVGNIVFVVLYATGFAMLRRKNAFTFWRYLAMEAFSCLPLLGALLWD
jgi:uncharacterized membrane protein